MATKTRFLYIPKLITMTGVNYFFTDAYQPFMVGGATIQSYLWCEIDGQLVAGSKTVPTVVTFSPTGTLAESITDWVVQVLQDMTGDSAYPYTFPGALDVANVFGVAPVVFTNTYNSRPGVAIAYDYNYNFGDLNLPVTIEGDPSTYKIWKMAFTGSGQMEQLAPGGAQMFSWFQEEGSMPIFHVLEIRPQ